MFDTARALAVAAALLLAVSRPSAARAQDAPCRSEVPGGRHAYAYQFRRDRCEGSCEAPASPATALRVVGFSRGAVFPRSPEPRLAVQWSASAGTAATLRVTATGPFCYQMDAEPPAARFSWSTHILRALQVQPAQLAGLVRIAAQVNGEPREVLVPVEPGEARMPDQPLIVHLALGRTFRGIVFEIRRAADDAVVVPAQRLLEAWFPGDRVVRFRVPGDLPREVPLRLHVVGEHPGGSSSTDEFLWIPR